MMTKVLVLIGEKIKESNGCLLVLLTSLRSQIKEMENHAYNLA